MSGNKIKRDLPNDEYQAAVGANNASASNVFATINDLTGVGGIEHGVAAGTNTYTVAIPGVVSYTDGDSYVVRFTNGSDADSTININGLGAITLTKQPGIQVTGGDIIAGQEMILIYDGTNFQCIGVAPNQLFAYVTNDEAITITKGQPVYAFGATGNRMSVKLAFNTSDATSAQTVGVVYSSSIAANQRGFIITQGVVGGLNTSMYAPGDQLYLGATAGSLTNVKPYAPNHLVYIGIVERANAGNGQIYVRTQNGYELDELHDVDLITTPPTDGQVLTYDSVTGLWRNESLPPAVSSGVFGIANTSGVYTFYSTLTLAMAAAVSGQTIEMFADVTTGSNVSINLKNGVNINGNGHTYSYSNSLGNCFQDNGASVICSILNLTISRTSSLSSGANVLLTGNSRIDFTGSYIYRNILTDNYACIEIQGAARVFNAYCLNEYGRGIWSTNANSLIENCFGQTIQNSGIGIMSHGNVIKSTGISVNLPGIDISSTNGLAIQCIGVSVSSIGIRGNTINCTGISTSGAGIGANVPNNQHTNSAGYSSSQPGLSGGSNAVFCYNCYFESQSGVAASAVGGEYYNCSVYSKWNNAFGNAIVSPSVVLNCVVRVSNSSALCLYSVLARTTRYASNTWVGATTPVSTGTITQGITTTEDNQGNILM